MGKRERGYKLILLIADVLAVTTAYTVSLLIRFLFTKEWAFYKPGEAPLEAYLKTFPYVLILWLVIFRFSGVYSTVLRGVDEFLVILKAVLFCVLISLSTAFFYRSFEYSRAVLVFFAFSLPFLVIGYRYLLRWFRHKILKTSGSITRVIIVGHNELGFSLAAEISRQTLGYEFVGFIQENNTENPSTIIIPESSCSIIGKLDDLEQLIQQQGITEVWIALPDATREKLLKLVEICLKTKISWKMVPDLYEVMLDWVKIDSLAGIPLIGMRRSNITGINIIIKRITDIIFSTILIILSSPFMLIVILLIKLTSKGPILFMQKRIGYDGKRFTFLKFRTMYEGINRTIHKDFTKQWIEGTVEQDNNEQKTVYKIKDDPRRTPIGKWLRKFSIDELPQLFNVVKGDMSLVGPRPSLAYEVEQYKEWHKRRLETKPGITGLWQVSGRNLLSFEEMVKLDIYYIENWSISLDLNIILKTVFIVLFGRAY